MSFESNLSVSLTSASRDRSLRILRGSFEKTRGGFTVEWADGRTVSFTGMELMQFCVHLPTGYYIMRYGRDMPMPGDVHEADYLRWLIGSDPIRHCQVACDAAVALHEAGGHLQNDTPVC